MIHTIIKYLLISATLFFCSCHKPKTDIITPAKQLIERQIGERAQSIHFEYIEPSDGKDIFEVIASDGRLTLRGSSSVAICRGPIMNCMNRCPLMSCAISLMFVHSATLPLTGTGSVGKRKLTGWLFMV